MDHTGATWLTKRPNMTERTRRAHLDLQWGGKEAEQRVDEIDFLVSENVDTTTLKVVAKINQVSTKTSQPSNSLNKSRNELICEEFAHMFEGTVKQAEISKRLFSEAHLEISLTVKHIFAIPLFWLSFYRILE